MGVAGEIRKAECVGQHAGDLRVERRRGTSWPNVTNRWKSGKVFHCKHAAKREGERGRGGEREREREREGGREREREREREGERGREREREGEREGERE